MPRGYGVLSVNGRETLAHRYVMAQRHSEAALVGRIVMHLCDNPPCINPDHLRIATQADNLADMRRKGRGRKKTKQPDQRLPAYRRGQAHWRAKLVDDDVREMLFLYDQGTTQAEIVRRYGISPAQVNHIVHRKAWTHVPYP